MPKIQQLLQRIKKRQIAEELIEAEDILMKEYGFIPNETLMKEPIPRILNLLRAIEKRYKREAREYEKNKLKRPRRR